ncbi:hypothetical protein [Fimbriiglobus ruber]|uniref:Uncharacterized protein n=1 Tax=Fimbriiglobus ruber TaxID=1908690 RepID=A0A225DJS6_9BACT|nr:hypothetical protein [Fimbriiglobus ruber]OWK41662.1 hypothetical protein FRUB_03740 [Fimbriiglobus ruber]
MRSLFALGLIAVLVTVGCKKSQPITAATTSTPPPAAPAAPNPGNTNYQAGGGAVQNVRQAGRRTVALNDLHNLGLAIKQVETLDGRMPDKARIIEEVKTYPNIPAAINEGVIILTGTMNSGGLWAYEVDANRVGGLVLVGGVARRAEATEVQQLLAQQ